MVEESDPSPGKVRLKITCPLYPIVEVEADAVELPAWDGTRTIIPGQAPLFCALHEGRMVIYQEDHPPVIYLISRGVCEVRRNICSVLAWGGRADHISGDQIKKQLTEAENMSKRVMSGTGRREVFSRIDFFKKVLEELKYDESASD